MESKTKIDRLDFRPRVVDFERLLEIGYEFLLAIGEDPKRAGLVETPRRWAESMQEFFAYDPGKIDTSFASIETDQLVVVKRMPVDSYCEHHIAPFKTYISVGYIVREKLLGLSKFARISQFYAHRLQVQERLVKQIANAVLKITSAPDVAVVASHGEHSCMCKRGIRSEGEMICSDLHGRFRLDPAARAEFMGIVGF